MGDAEKKRDFQYFQGLLDAIRPLEGEWCVICPFGIGDTYFVCSLAEQFLHYNGGTRFSVVVKPGQEDIPLLFPGISRIFVADNINIEAIQQFNSFTPGNLIIGHPRYYGDGRLELLCGSNGYTLLDLYYHILRIPARSPLALPKVPNAYHDSANIKFAETGLPEGRTVLLAPYANSSRTMPLSFWSVLSGCLRELGWSVATSVSPQYPNPIPGTAAVMFGLGEAIPFAEKAGWVISSRSGLCDLLSSLQSKLTILYLRQTWNSGTVLTGCGLGVMGLSARAHEIEISPEDDIVASIRQVFCV